MRSIGILLLFLTACVPLSSSFNGTGDLSGAENSKELNIRVVLPDLGVAPELHNQVWLNTEQPLRLADLRGKVVLFDMWTYG